jgi:hypothetical protein
MNRPLSLLSAVALLALGACDDSDSGVPASGLSDSYFTTKEAAGVPVLALRESVKSGDDVVVAGRAKDFVDGRAVFTLIDSSLRACSDEGDPMEDSCETPWDYCCHDPREIAKATVTVELRDAGGVIASSVRGFHGLDHLDRVVVYGKASKDEAGNVTIAASGIHVP